MSTIDIRIVDAALEPQLLAAYCAAQIRALSLAGYPPLESSRPQDWDTGECALVLAFEEDSALIGGVRLQRHVSDRPMPCAEVLRAALPGVDANADEESWILRVDTDTLRTMPHRDRALRAHLHEMGKGERASAGPRGLLNFRYDLL